MTIQPVYIYRATVVRVTDGDTYRLSVDLGFKVSIVIDLRVLGLFCPEVKGPSREAGERARVFAENLLPVGAPVLVQTTQLAGRDVKTFDRYVGDVFIGGCSMAGLMVAAGMGSIAPTTAHLTSDIPCG